MSTATTSWVLQLVDKITAPLRNIQEQTRRSTTQMNQLGSGGGTSIDLLKTRIEAYTTSMNRATDPTKIIWHRKRIAEMQGQLEQLKNVPPESFFSRMQRGDGLLGNLYKRAGALVGIMAVLGTVKFAVGAAAEAEKTAMAFEVLLKSAEKGKEMVDNLNQMANATPYNPNTLQDAAKTMLSFGIAQTDVMDNLKAIGNIAMGDANKVNSLTLAFSQMTATGKLTGQDLMQMINAGFNPLQTISDKTGKSIGVLKEAMEKGAISADMVREAFLAASGEGGLFDGMMEKMAGTFSGKWTAFTGKIQLMMTELGSKLLPMLSKGIDLMSRFFDFVGRNAHIFKPIIIGITAGALAWGLWSVATGAAAIATQLSAVSISAAIFSIPIIGWMALAIAAIAALVAYFWTSSQKFREILFGLWEATKTIFSGIGSFVKEVLEGIWHVIKGVFNPKNWFDENYNISDGLKKITDAATKYGEAIGKSFAEGRKKGAKSFEESQKEKQGKESGAFSLNSTNKNVDFNALLGKGSKNAKGKSDAQGIGLGGSGGGGGSRAVTMNVTMNNNFSVAGGLDIKNVSEQIFRLINDRLRDAAVTAG